MFTGPNIVSDGLRIFLDAANPKSYPGSGNTWYDLTNFNNHVTLYNTPTFVSTHGGGLDFDGTNEHGIIPDPSDGSLDFGTSDFSIAAVLKTDTLAGYHGIFIKGASGATGYSITMDNNGRISIDIDAPDNTHLDSSSTLLTVGETVMVHCNFDRDTQGETYFNGVLKDTFPTLSGQSNSVSNSKDIGIGTYSTGTQWFWDGTFFQIYVYNKILTAEEVLQNYNATKSRFGL